MLRIFLLGGQIAEDDATGEVRSRSSRTLALIGFLALHAGVAQSRQLIAGRFWPDSTDAQALTNLRRELHHLRRLLGTDTSLEVSSTDLCWRDTDTCQVDLRVLRTRAEQARRQLADDAPSLAARLAADAVAAYGGDLLPAVYDEWVVAERDRLRRECVDLCDLLVEIGPRHGALTPAVDAARRRIALEPLEEVGYRALMRLQVEAGDRAGAISTYHHCASVLQRELGVAPDPATRRALERLIGPPSPADGPGPRAEERPAVPTRAPLIGRAEALAGLQRMWEDTVAEQRPRVVVVQGVAGVGKSRLVAELAGRVRSRRGTVAFSQCFDTSGRLVLAPVADWLRADDLREASRSLDPVWRQEVERLVPDVQPGGPRAGGSAGPPAVRAGQSSAPPARSGDRAKVDAWQRRQFFEGLAQPFLELRRPLLLVLDNLQWCDAETLAWVSFLLGRGPRTRVMVAATLREGHGEGSPTSEWLAGLRTGRLVHELSLDPLGPAETATLSAAVTGAALSEQGSELLHATTGGFPLYVIEATRAAGAAEPPDAAGERLGSVLRRRIGQTSHQAQQTAGLAAALGRDFTLDLLTEASDLDEDTVARAVDELWRGQIVRELGAGYDFSHDLLRDAAYEMVSPPQRWLLHRRLAQALELSAAGGDDLSALLAEQYERGGRPDRAREHYGRAAEVAAARFAAGEAVRLHRRALAIVTAQPPGPQRDERELGCLLALAAPLNAQQGYSSPDMRTVLERAVHLAESLGSNQRLVSSLLGLWSSRFVQGDIVDSLRVAARALSLSEVGAVLLGEAHFAYAGSSATLGRPADAVEHFDIAHDSCRGAESLVVGTMPEVHALAWSAHAHWLLGQAEVAADRAAEAVGRARSFAHPYSLAVALAYASITYQLLDDTDALDGSVEELGELSSRYGFAYYAEWGLVLGGWLRGGQQGVGEIRRGVENLRRQLSLARMPYWLSLLADAQARDGRTEEAVAVLDAAHMSASSRGDAWWLPEITRLRAAHGPTEHRERLLRTALDLAERQGSRALAERCRRDLGDLSGPQDLDDRPGRTVPAVGAGVAGSER